MFWSTVLTIFLCDFITQNKYHYRKVNFSDSLDWVTSADLDQVDPLPHPPLLAREDPIRTIRVVALTSDFR